MKSIITLSTLVITTLLFSCNTASDSDGSTETPSEINSNELSIQGTMKGGNENMVYLFSFADTDPLKVDSTMVDSQGDFILKRDQNGYEIMGVGFTPAECIPLIVNSKEQIKMIGAKDTWVKETTISGSENSELMLTYNKRRLQFFDKMNELRATYEAMDPNDAVGIDEISKQGQILQTDFNTFKNDYINSNINKPAIAAAIPDITNIREDLERFKKMEATISKYLPETAFATSISKMLKQTLDFDANQVQQMQEQQQPKGLAIGTAAPDLDFATPSGEKIKLSSLKGQVVLLDFWASWCGPCRKENPNVVKVYNEYKDKGFTVYSVSLDNKKPNWLAAIEKDGLVWPNHVSDLKGWQSDAAAIYGINSIPMTYLLDADGIIVASNLRGPQLETKLKEILK